MTLTQFIHLDWSESKLMSRMLSLQADEVVGTQVSAAGNGGHVAATSDRRWVILASEIALPGGPEPV